MRSHFDTDKCSHSTVEGSGARTTFSCGGHGGEGGDTQHQHAPNAKTIRTELRKHKQVRALLGKEDTQSTSKANM